MAPDNVRTSSRSTGRSALLVLALLAALLPITAVTTARVAEAQTGCTVSFEQVHFTIDNETLTESGTTERGEYDGTFTFGTAGSGTWSLVLENTGASVLASINWLQAFASGGLVARLGGQGGGSGGHNLTATFNATIDNSDGVDDIQVGVYGNAGENLQSAYDSYSLEWTGGGTGTIYDPSNQIDMGDADGEPYTSGTTFNQDGIITNTSLRWSVVTPTLSDLNFVFRANVGSIAEAFRFDVVIPEYTCQPPVLNLTKSVASSTGGAVGDTVNYEFLVENPGPTDVDDLVVTDPLISSITCPATALAVGESTTCTGTYTIDTDDRAAGQIDNEATATAASPDAQTASATDTNTYTLPYVPTAAWTVTKSTASTPTDPGDTLDYTFEVENTGDLAISDVAVTDDKCAADPAYQSGDTDTDDELDTDETWTYTCTSIEVTQAEVDAGQVDNDVSVSGTPASGTLADATDTESTTITPDPAWSLVKSTTSTPADPGDTLDYTFELSNDGNVSISAIAVTDDKCASGPTYQSGDTDTDDELDADETWTYTCTSIQVTKAEVDAGQVDNTAEATGTPAAGTLDHATGSESVTVAPDPAWSVIKSTTSTPTAAGDTLDYSFAVSNDGNVSISAITVTDAKCAATPVLDSGDTDTDSALDVDETWTYTCTSIPVTQAEVDAGQVDNDVSVSGTPARGTLDPAPATHSVTVDPAPSWTVTKSNTSTPADAGDSVGYSFEVDNTGNVSIDTVNVSDVKCASDPAFTGGDTDSDGELDPDETWAYTCTSIGVTQAEVDAGQVDNEVEVTGTAVAGTLPKTTDTHSIAIDGRPTMTVVKAASSAPTKAGDTINYTFTVVNTGNVTIGDVTIDDDKCATTPVIDSETNTVDGDLQVAETQVWSCTSVGVTQAEIDAGEVLNSVTADGTPAQGDLVPATDDHEVSITGAPSWSMTKATSSNPAVAGDTLDYTFTLVNTGTVTITGVAIVDDKCATTPVLDSESVSDDTNLEVGETQVWSCTSIPVTQAEVDAGNVHNEAIATGTTSNGDLDPAEGSVDKVIGAAPAWSMTKATSSAPSAAGDTLDYTLELSNDGNVSISAVTVTDDKCASGPTYQSGDTDADDELDADETWTYTCTSIPVTQAEVDAGQVDNTATATGTPVGGLLPNTEGSSSTTIDPSPAWNAVKTTSSTPSHAGDTLDYTFTVVNTGNVTINAVSVTDDKCATTPALDSESIADNTALDVGETQIWSCTSVGVTQAEINAGEILNSALVTGSPAGGVLPDLEPTHEVGVLIDPKWEMVKTAATTPTKAGDTITYNFVLVNTGNVPISAIAITDDKCSATPTLASESITADETLEVGENQSWTCTSIPVTQAEVDAGQVDNTATATGTPAAGTLDPTEGSRTVAVVANPDWSLVKSTASVPTAAGDTLDYTFRVVNTGNVTITGVALSDAKCATAPTLDAESIADDAVLQVDETQIWSCTSIPVTQAEVDAGTVANSATATGSPSGGTLPPATGTVDRAIDPDPNLSVIKATTSMPTAAGDELDYTFSVVNTGNVTIDNVAVSDAKCATVPALDSESISADAVLQVGETQIWSCTSVPVTQAEMDLNRVDNTVDVTGTTPAGETVEATDSLTSPTATNPSWALVKAATNVAGKAGDTLTYAFTVVNDGNVTISAVTVSDPKCASGPTLDFESITLDNELEVGETQIWSCTSIPVTQAEVDAGQADNIATATGTPAQGVLPSVEGTHTASISRSPSWSLVKAATSEAAQAGDTIDYEFSVINTGNVTISAVSVSDPKCAAAPALAGETDTADGVLQVGETQTWTCTSIPVTQAEVNAGEAINTATATGTPAGGNLPDTTDQVVSSIEPAPAFELVKASTTVIAGAEDTIEYTFTVVNTGNVTINDVAVGDPKCAAAPALAGETDTADGVLQVGETQTWTCTSIPVTQAEVDAGEALNTATVSGTPAGGNLPDVEGSHVLAIEADPSLAAVKTTADMVTAAGDTLVYTFTVVNTGNVTIEAVQVTDAKCATAPAIVSENITADATLQVGETQIWSCTSIPATQAEVDAGQVDNQVMVTGTPTGGVLPGVEGTHSVGVDPNPAWAARKSTTSAPTAAGQTLDYFFEVENLGNVTIGDITVTDTKCASGPNLVSGDADADGRLGTDEVWVYECTSIPVTQAEVDAGRVDNTATVTGTPAGGTLAPTEAHTSTPIEPAPAMEAVKTTTSLPSAAGETLDYTFTLVNTGNVTIEAVQVTDAKCATAPAIDSESIATDGALQVGETQIWSCTSIPVTQAEADAGEVRNAATIDGTPTGGELPEVQVEHTREVGSNPQIDVVKATSSRPTSAGETLQYDFTVVNSGSVTIRDLALTDAKCAGAPTLVSESALTDGVLQVGETQIWTCTSIPVTQAEVDAGEILNTVEVDGTPPGGELPTATSTTTTGVDAEPEIELEKESTGFTDTNGNGMVDAGDHVNYRFIVTNTGNVTLYDVDVSDVQAIVSGGPIPSLAPGETDSTLTSRMVLTQVDIDNGRVDNAAVAHGTDPNGTEVTDQSDSTDPAASGSVGPDDRPLVDENGDPVDDGDPTNDPTRTLLVADPALTVTKVGQWVDVNGNGVMDVGDHIDYSFTVANVGNVTITNISIDDPLAPVSGTIDSLAPGESDTTTFSASYEFTADDLNAGRVENSATATGSDPSGEPVDAKSDDPTNTTDVDTDGDGHPDDPTVTVLTPEVPEAEDDRSTGNQPGSAVTIDPLANDHAEGEFDPASVRLFDEATGEWVTELDVPGEGTWTVDTATGEVTFTPENGFDADPTPVRYQAALVDGGATVESGITVEYVDPPAPRPVAISAPPPPAAPVPTPTPTPKPKAPDALAFSGSESALGMALAIALIGFGVAMVSAGRRRQD